MKTKTNLKAGVTGDDGGCIPDPFGGKLTFPRPRPRPVDAR